MTPTAGSPAGPPSSASNRAHGLGSARASTKSSASSSSSASASSPTVPLSAEAKAKRDRIKAKQAQMAMQATLRQTLSAAIDQNEAQESVVEKQRQQELEAAQALLLKMPVPKRKAAPILIPQAALAGSSASTAASSAAAAPASAAAGPSTAAASSSAAAAPGASSTSPTSATAATPHKQSAAARMAAASKMQNRVLNPDAPGTVAVARRRSSIIAISGAGAAAAGPSRKPTSPDRSERTVGAGLPPLTVDPSSPSSAASISSAAAVGSTRALTRTTTGNSSAGVGPLTRSHAASVASAASTRSAKAQSPAGNDSLPRGSMVTRGSSIPVLATGTGGASSSSSSALPAGDPPIARVNSTPSKVLAKSGASSASDPTSPPSDHRSPSAGAAAATGSAEAVVPRDRKASTATGRSDRKGSTAMAGPASPPSTVPTKFKNINAKLKAAQLRQKTMRGLFPQSATTITVTAPDMNPLATEAAANAAAAAAIAAALTDSDSDDPTSGHTRKRFGALFDNNDDDDDEAGGRRKNRDRDRDRDREREDSDAEPADGDAPNASEDSQEGNRARARARRRKLVPGPKKRTVSFSSIYNALQLGSDDDLMGGASTQQPSNAGETSVSNMDSSKMDGAVSGTGGGGAGGNSSGDASQALTTKLPKLPKKKRDINNLGPRPRKFEAHGRFQLWIVGLLYWLAIVLQLCSLWSNAWIEDRNSLLGVQNKDLLQWLMVGGSVILGIAGYVCMMLRFHGAGFAHNGYKFAAILALTFQTGLAVAATELWKVEYQHVIDAEPDTKQWGSSFNFVILSRTYGFICIVLLLWQEATEYLSRNRAWKLAAALGRLRVMRAEAEMKALARLRAQEAAETPYEDGTMPPPFEEDPAIEAAEAEDFQRSTDNFLKELTALGLSVDASKRLNLAALPSPESVTALAHTLYLDKDYLSRGQRRLVWTSIVFFCVVFGGGMLYAELEGWNARAAIDFALVSLATIGYGNMAPKTTVGRCFMFLYFPMGFAVVGMTVNTLWKVVLIKLDHRFNELSRYISKALADRREAEEAIRAMKEELEKKIMEERLRQAIMEHQKMNHEGEFEDEEGGGEEGEPGEGGDGEEGIAAGERGRDYSRSKSSLGDHFYRENSRGEFEHLECAPDEVTQKDRHEQDDEDDLERGRNQSASERDVAIDVSDAAAEGRSPGAAEQKQQEQKSPHHDDELPSYHGTLNAPLNPVAAAMVSADQGAFPPPPPPQPPNVPAPADASLPPPATAGRLSPLPIAGSPASSASVHSARSVSPIPPRHYSISDVPSVVDADEQHPHSHHKHPLAGHHGPHSHKNPEHHHRHANHEKQKAHASHRHMQHNMAPGPFAAFASVLADGDDSDDDDDLAKPVAPVPLLSAEPHEHLATEFSAGPPRPLTPTLRGDSIADPASSNGAVELAMRPSSALHTDAHDPSDANAEPLFEEIEHPHHGHPPHGPGPLVPAIQFSALSSQTRAAISSAKKARRFGTKKVKLFLAVLFCCGWILLSSWLFAVLENWEYFEAVWFSFITLSTIGYGDFYTSNSDSSAFFLWFVIFGLGSVTYVLTLMSEILMESADLQKEAEIKRKQKQRKKAAKAKADAREARDRERRHRHAERDASFVRDVSVIPEEGEYDMHWQDNQLLEAEAEGAADAVGLGTSADGDTTTGAGTGGAKPPSTPKESEPSTPKGTPKASQRVLATGDDCAVVPDMMTSMILPPSVTSTAGSAASGPSGSSTPAPSSSSISVPAAPPMRATPRLSISAAGGNGRSLMVPSPATSPGGAADAIPMAPPMSSASAPPAAPQAPRPHTQFNLALTDTQKQQILIKSRIESISLVPAALFLEFAEEFASKTKEVLAAAQAAVQHAEEHASLFDPTLLDSYHASYASLLRAEEKRAKVFETAWMKNMLAMTAVERAEAEKAPAPSRAQMLQQINQIKDFKMHLMQRKQQQQQQQQGGPGASAGAAPQMSAAAHAANAAAFRNNAGAKRGSITGAGGPAAASSGLPARSPPMARIVSEEPVSDVESSSESENEDADLDWSTVGDRRRISRLIPVAPPIAPPLVKATKVALERLGSRSIGGTPANAAAISAAAEAAVGPGGKALSPMEAAAAVARAMFEAKRKQEVAKQPQQSLQHPAGSSGSGQHHAGASSRVPAVEYLAPYESPTDASSPSGSASSEPPKRPAPAPRRASIMLPISSASGGASSSASSSTSSSSSSAAGAGIAPALLKRQGAQCERQPLPVAVAGSHKGGYFAAGHEGEPAADTADNKNKDGAH